MELSAWGIRVGGSAANASHAVNDFRKLAGFEAYTPSDNVSELTARTNDEGWETVKPFLADLGVNYRVVIGNDATAQIYGGVDALPTTFYIGRDGKIVTRVFGLVSHREIEDNVRAALKQGPAVAQNSSPAAGAAR
jgi:hypothetical protein